MTILKTRQFLIEYFYLNITEFSNKLRLANDFLLFNKRFFACNIPDEFLNSSQINHYPYLFQNYCSNYWIMKILPNQSRTSHSIYFTHRTRRARVHVHMHTYAHTHTRHMIVTHFIDRVSTEMSESYILFSELQISHCLDGHSLDLYFVYYMHATMMECSFLYRFYCVHFRLHSVRKKESKTERK